MISNSKKGQASIIAFWKVIFAGALFFPLISIYNDFKPHLMESITNPFIIFVVVVLPFVYWIGVAFLFVNTLKGVVR
jgi:hypothetical protein